MNKKELKECLKADFKQTLKDVSFQHILFSFCTSSSAWKRWKFIKAMRRASYHEELFRKKRIYHVFPMIFYLRRCNKLGNLLGFEIKGTNIGKGLTLYHNGPIVINRDAVVGTYCKLHGDNCIGNNGISKDCPIIGNNVDIGVGAKILGRVVLADNIIVAAGAVVVKSFLEPGITIGGVPACKIK